MRAGDQDAATALVKSYELEIRRVVRFRLTDARLGNLLDSMDICQSVMKSFFVRAASGQYELETPAQLLALLATMARNRLVSQARKQHAGRRDRRRVTSGGKDEGQLVDPGAGPSTEVDARDLLQEIRNRLSADERQIMELRNQGHDWETIAARRQRGFLADEAETGARQGRRAARPGRRVMTTRPADDPPARDVPAEGSDPDRPLLALVLAHQRRGWRRGEPALVETYLDRHPELQGDAETVLDLIYNEIVLREQAGEAPSLKEYLRRFPRLAPIPLSGVAKAKASDQHEFATTPWLVRRLR